MEIYSRHMSLPNRNDADDELFRAIGTFVVCWGNIEFILDSIVILNNIKLEKNATSPLQYNQKIDEIADILRNYGSPNLQVKFSMIRDQLEGLFDLRNSIIHGFPSTHVEGSGELTLNRLVHRQKSIIWNIVTAQFITDATTNVQKLSSELYSIAYEQNEDIPRD